MSKVDQRSWHWEQDLEHEPPGKQGWMQKRMWRLLVVQTKPLLQSEIETETGQKWELLLELLLEWASLSVEGVSAIKEKTKESQEEDLIKRVVAPKSSLVLHAQVLSNARRISGLWTHVLSRIPLGKPLSCCHL